MNTFGVSFTYFPKHNFQLTCIHNMGNFFFDGFALDIKVFKRFSFFKKLVLIFKCRFYATTAPYKGYRMCVTLPPEYGATV